ncbi:MAG: CPBP family intramembrane metalloprotease [Taibaiella sp.]|nr:CPBP family intramembrane metalloprotease [Taibaiella sp.]
MKALSNRYLQTALILTGAFSYYWYKYLYAYVILGLHRYQAMPVEARQWLIGSSVLFTCIIITFALTSFNLKKAFHSLGLDKQLPAALIAAVICTLPMFLGAWAYAEPNRDFGWRAAFDMAIWPGFNEELVFRGFIVGLLVRLARWPIVPAMVISAMIFAWGHLYQAENPSEILPVFLVTSGAGVGFAIFYCLWGWNLWFPVFMHILMNLSFALFHTGDNVLLNETANIFRGITIGLAIITSVFINYRNKRKQAFEQRTA